MRRKKLLLQAVGDIGVYSMIPRLSVYLLVRLVEPVRVEEEPRLERPRGPVGEVTDEEVVVVVEEDEEEVVEETRSSCRLPKEPLWDEGSGAERETRVIGRKGSGRRVGIQEGVRGIEIKPR